MKKHESSSQFPNVQHLAPEASCPFTNVEGAYLSPFSFIMEKLVSRSGPRHIEEEEAKLTRPVQGPIKKVDLKDSNGNIIHGFQTSRNRLFTHLMDLDLTWSDGPFQHKFPINEDRSEYYGIHKHTAFDIKGKLVHIDHFDVYSHGPLRGMREFRVFVNGKLQGRGGGGGCLGAGTTRNMPLGVVIGSFMVLCEQNHDKWLVNHSYLKSTEFSLWEKVSNNRRPKHNSCAVPGNSELDTDSDADDHEGKDDNK